MLIQETILTNLKIQKLTDLRKLKEFQGGSNLKVNKSELARKLGVDRRTVSKYIDGYEKPSVRLSVSQFDAYYEIIKALLENEVQVFAYKRILWQYMVDTHNMPGAYSSFRKYVKKHDELQKHFMKTTAIKTANTLRFETDAGNQAQVDWKEKMTFQLDTGETLIIHIFVFLLSFSRFRVYRLSLTMTRDVVMHYLNNSFEVIGGVPSEILVDNMKTVMDSPRTNYSKGKVNDEFQTFANDYGFQVKPCLANRPQTKAKVESPMRILKELMAYNGQLSYDGLIRKLSQINDRENNRYHDGYQAYPILGLKKEKDSLKPLPPKTIRNHYHIKTERVKVNLSSMITYRSRQYSVAPEYIGKHLEIQVVDNHLCIYYDKLMVTIHPISEKKLNYLHEHYVEIAKLTLPFDDYKINEIAKENLERIGKKYETNDP
jgi:transposase